jgi:hypothetical protein
MDTVDRLTATRATRNAPASPHTTARRDTGLRRWPDPEAALILWSRLIQLRNEGDPPFVAQTEEELFQFYVPLAHTLAHDHDTSGDPDHARRRAELGLAKAILIWPLPDVAWFEEYARNAIRAEFVNGSERTLPMNPLLRRARRQWP